MKNPLRIAVVGDFNPQAETHRATNAALDHSAQSMTLALSARWLPTGSLESSDAELEASDGIWIAPGSPYRSMAGALAAIRFARLRGVPLLGTCGGFQHIVLEYARNVLGFADAHHAEYDPSAPNLFVVPLTCSLVGKTAAVRIRQGSRVFACYRAAEALEPYRCSFGLNHRHRAALEEAGLEVVGEDENREARIVEIPGHRFFVGTLFVPQLRSTRERPHPLVNAFVAAARDFAGQNASTARQVSR